MHAGHCVCAFLVLLHNILAVNSSCVKEEGNQFNLTANSNNTKKNNIIWKRNGLVYSTCYLQGCQCYPQTKPRYSVTFSCVNDDVSSVLAIESVSRHSSHNDSATWSAEDGGTILSRCDPLVIYAKPENSTCSVQQLKPGDTYLSMTCVTKKVFPKAKCLLYNSNGRNLPEARINCSHKSNNADPEYFESTCTVNIGISTLGVGQHQLFVKMFPDVTDGLNIAYIDSNVVSVNLSNPVVVVNSNCFNGPKVKGNFIKTGTNTSCTCNMTNTGNPPGEIQWYRQGNSTPLSSLQVDGSVIYTITQENAGSRAPENYSCRASSALNGSFQSNVFERGFAYGPANVKLTGQNHLNLCSTQDENITGVCSVSTKDVNPMPVFRISFEGNEIQEKEKIENTTDFSYSYFIKPNEPGNKTVLCEVENSVFNEPTNTASHRVTVEGPPKLAPTITFTSQEREIEIIDSYVKIKENKTVTVTCKVDGGFPPAIVSLKCPSLNQSKYDNTSNVVSLNFVSFTRDLNNQSCICTAVHTSGCYENNETSVWLSVSSTEIRSKKNTDLVVAAIIGGIAAVVIVIVLVVLVICVLMRKGVFVAKKKKNELDMQQISSEVSEEETVTDCPVDGTSRPKSKEIVTENDLYGTSRPKSKETVTENNLYGTQPIPAEVDVQNENVTKDARDYSSFTPSMTSAAALPGNFDTANSANDQKPEKLYSDVAVLPQTKPPVGVKPKPAPKPKTSYNNVKIACDDAGTGLVVQEDNGNQTYTSVVKPPKVGSTPSRPKSTFSSDEDFYPDQSKKPDIPKKKFLKDDKDTENEKKQQKERKADEIPVMPKAKAYEDVGLPGTSDCGSSNTNNGFTEEEDETNIYANTGDKTH